MNRILLTLFVLIAMSVAEAGAKQLVPLKGSASSEYRITEVSENGDCPGGLTLTLPGSHDANLSHLGLSAGSSTVTYNTCFGTYLMDLTFEAANGDTLRSSGAGYDLFPPGPDGGISSFADFEITGGTGRFEGASGYFSLEGLRYDYPDAPSVDTFELQGMISSVGSTKSVHAVPEPTSVMLILTGWLAITCLAARSRSCDVS